MNELNTLTVYAINPKDAGTKKQIGTMNLKTMKKYNLKTGTWISVLNPSNLSMNCVVYVWPANIQEARDLVSFRALNPKIHFAEAENITLQEEHDSEADYSILHQIPKDILLLILNQQLAGSTLIKGNKINTSIYGRSFTFIVEELIPENKEKDKEKIAFSISLQTRIILRFNSSTKIDPDAQAKNSLTLPLIGGLKDEIKSIKEMVELALTDICKEYGITPPRGILLHGVSGTGKTLIAKSIASSLTYCKFFTINGPDFFSGFLGESEAKLRAFFEEASKSAPAIIFIDEIDGICPKREKGSDVENRIVATLLTIMDGIGNIDMNKVIVIGATNRIDSIDESLRRGGRFDREIEIGIPNSEARRDIFGVYLKQIPNSLSEENVETLASKTHGYVGADIANLCREAALICLKRHIGSDFQSSIKKQIDLSQLKVAIADFDKAMKEIRPNLSTIRDVVVEVPKVHWSDIGEQKSSSYLVGGYEDVKQQIKESVELPLTHPEVFMKFNISPPKGILLYGPPGCSKTLMAKAIATESGLNFIAVKGPELYSKWVGQSEKSLSSIFKKAKQASPSILFFDEIDALVGSRGDGGDSGTVTDRVISQLLIEMNGLQSIGRVTVVAATNRPQALVCFTHFTTNIPQDESLLSAGRFDRLLYIPPPDIHAREEIFKISIRKMKVGEDVDIRMLAKMTEGCSGAEIALICREAALAALQEDIHAVQVTLQHFMKSVNSTKPAISREMLSFYENFHKKVTT